MLNKRICIIGTGQIGSRHFEGIIKENFPYDIFAFDPNLKSQKLLKEKWIEVGGDKTDHKFFQLEKLNHLPKNLDLVIVSTSSKNRAELIKNLSPKIKPCYWIIEKVLAQSSEELDVVKYATEKAKGIYVNNGYRLTKLYQHFKTKFSGQKPLRVKVEGGAWGLCCNSIHFIDLISWWTNEILLSVNTKELNESWIKSKRKDYFECTGKLIVKFSGGTELLLHSNLHSKEQETKLTVELPNNNIWTINGSKGISQSSNGDIFNKRLEFQSEMTGAIVTKILTKGICELPNLQESIVMHRIFLDSMLSHWNRSNNCNHKLVPIT
jgi:predicted dehydrogenase